MTGRAAPTWTVHTEVFDGPMDLLLYLVQRDGIDLRRLPIAPIADSYLAWLDRMRELNLAIAGDYLVMAATLVHLKSLELIPRLPTRVDDAEEDPREELARRLADYARYREAAEAIGSRPRVDRDVFVRRPAELGSRPLARHDPHALLDAFYPLLAREAAPEPVLEMEGGGPDFETCCVSVLDALGGRGGTGELGGMLRSLGSRTARVLTFVAVLEMVRLGWLGIDQDRHLGPVDVVQLVERSAISFEILTGWVEASATP